MSCALIAQAELASYSVTMTNDQHRALWMAIYRKSPDQETYQRRSAAKLVQPGKTVSFGGIRGNFEFSFFGSLAQEKLAGTITPSEEVRRVCIIAEEQSTYELDGAILNELLALTIVEEAAVAEVVPASDEEQRASHPTLQAASIVAHSTAAEVVAVEEPSAPAAPASVKPVQVPAPAVQQQQPKPVQKPSHGHIPAWIQHILNNRQ